MFRGRIRRRDAFLRQQVQGAAGGLARVFFRRGFRHVAQSGGGIRRAFRQQRLDCGGVSIRLIHALTASLLFISLDALYRLTTLI